MTQYYVNAITGNDTYDGLSATDDGGGVGPWLTLARADGTGIPAVVASDTVNITGTFNERLTPAVSGSAGNIIIYIGFGAGATIDRGDATLNTCVKTGGFNYITIDNITMLGAANGVDAFGTNVTIQNCDISGMDGVSNAVGADSSVDFIVDNCNIHDCPNVVAGVKGKNSTRLIVRNSTIVNMGGDGINADNPTDILIENNTIRGFTDTAGGHADGIVFEDVNGAVIRYNLIFDYTQNIYLSPQGEPSTATNVEIYGNVIFTYNYGKPDFLTSGAVGINVVNTSGTYGVTNLWIYNNTILFCGATKAINIDVDVLSGLIVRNNLFHRVHGTAVNDVLQVTVATVDVTATEDIEWNAYSGPAADGPDSNLVSGSGSDISPLLVNYTYNSAPGDDPANFDFHLVLDSPVIAAGRSGAELAIDGITVPVPWIDRDEVTRDNKDIGAYEFVAAAADVPGPSSHSAGGSVGVGVGVLI